MHIAGILERKGSAVETTPPDASLASAVHRLVALGIGALVVSPDGRRVDGIVSEREVVRALSRHGATALDRRVADVMVRTVPTCAPADSVKHVMAVMTRTRHRHLPVIDRSGLCGLVSIGDVVKFRVDEAELETSVLRDAYLARR
jgi:CBS domain-containing protein